MNRYNSPLVRTVSFLIFMILLFLNGCISQKKVEYLYDKKQNTSEFNSKPSEIPKIKPGDELYIRVSSFDESTYNFFITQAEGRAQNYPNDLSVSLVSYGVNDSGYIYFPVLNKVYLAGKTIEEANETLQQLLSEYFRQPNVTVSFVAKKITVLGEIRNPGYFTYTNARISIFQALGMAGDITVLGNKKKILIIRENKDKVLKNYVDLTSDDIVGSEFYYLQPNDVVFVAPARARQWSISSTPIQLILTSITTLILLLNYFDNN
jgi:polysaccharide biosynthesis/export protein